jgi:CheY-like chemotaxis protein
VENRKKELTQRRRFPVANPKCRVLCVDDHRDTSEMLQMLLAEEDYVVHTAATMEEACAMASRTEYDLYVLDKRLPDGTGIQLCSTLLKLTPRVPCIFYTGDAYEIHRREALAVGAAAFVAKPDIEGLINAVHHLLSNSECASAT